MEIFEEPKISVITKRQRYNIFQPCETKKKQKNHQKVVNPIYFVSTQTKKFCYTFSTFRKTSEKSWKKRLSSVIAMLSSSISQQLSAIVSNNEVFRRCETQLFWHKFCGTA